MARVSDKVTVGELVKEAAKVLTRAGLEHRIDLFREIEVDDPVIRMMLGRSHKVRVRVRITATSLLFDQEKDPAPRRGAEICSSDELVSDASQGLVRDEPKRTGDSRASEPRVLGAKDR